MPRHLSQPLMPPSYVAGLEEPPSNFLSCTLLFLSAVLAACRDEQTTGVEALMYSFQVINK